MTGTHSRFAAARVLLIGVGLSGALLLHACASDDDKTPETAAPPATIAAATTAPGDSTSAATAATTSASASPSASPETNPTLVASGGAIDACRLVTKADAETALGEEVGDAEAEVTGAARLKAYTCTYVSKGNYGAHVVFFSVGTGNGEKAVFDLAKQTYKDAKPIPGIGDEAFLVELDAPVSQVHVRKGDTYFIVAITQIAEHGRPAEATALARLIASRI